MEAFAIRDHGRVGLVLALALMLVVAFGPRPGGAQAPRDIYTVSDIAVDVTAEDAVAARDQALDEGQREGLRRLLERFTAPEARARLPRVEALPMERYVRSIEIDDEELAPNRYIARLTVTYDPGAVRELLEGAEVAYAMDPSPPQLVLPVLETADAQLLWEEPNPWRAAWSEHAPRHTLMQLVLPLGDLQDVTTVDASMAFRGEREPLARMAERYEAEAVLVARAVPMRVETPQGPALHLELEARRVAPDYQVLFEETLRGQPDQDLSELLALGVGRIALGLEREWARDRQLRHDLAESVMVEVALAELADWVHISNTLRAIPEVRETAVDAFARDLVRLRVDYVGGRGRLDEALARRGLRLVRDGETWRLRPMTDMDIPDQEPAPTGTGPST